VHSTEVEITALLRMWRAGDREALDKLIPHVYTELRRIARRYVRREKAQVSVDSGVLVNEAYVRLVGVDVISWHDRAHFFAVSAQLMRRILVDAARARASAKRRPFQYGHRALNLDQVPDLSSARDRELIAINDALSQLAQLDQRKARVVELRFFGGLTVEETAVALGISTQSVLRDWKLAKAWLRRAISGEHQISTRAGMRKSSLQ
jgi:RNA polymerase sigma factor (TIGR02999 family)